MERSGNVETEAVEIRKNGGTQSPTVKDVAAVAGVSVGTVSRYLNGERLKPRNAERVAEAIQTLGFRRNLIAGGLRSGRSLAIGVLMDDFRSMFMSELVSSIESAIEVHDYGVIISDYHANANRLAEKVNFLLDRNVDGIILFPHAYQRIDEALELLLSSRIPVCLVNEPRPGTPWDTVLTDNRAASQRAVELLTSMGHRAIGGIAGDLEFEGSRSRLAGARDALESASLPYRSELWPVASYSMQEAYQKTLELLRRPERPTALFGMSYNMTLGALRAIHDLELRVPKDISIVSFDDIDLFQAIRPRITAVRQPVAEMGASAVSLLLRRLRNEGASEPERRIVPSDFIVRDSVGPPPDRAR